MDKDSKEFLLALSEPTLNTIVQACKMEAQQCAEIYAKDPTRENLDTLVKAHDTFEEVADIWFDVWIPTMQDKQKNQ